MKTPLPPLLVKRPAPSRELLSRSTPALMDGVLDKRVRQILEEQSTTYSRMRVTKRNKSFFSTSFYSNHPHYKRHVDLQHMSIFKRSRLADHFNFMLICIDNFSNYMMVKLLHDKRAITVHKAIIDLIREEGSLPTIIYCDQWRHILSFFIKKIR